MSGVLILKNGSKMPHFNKYQKMMIFFYEWQRTILRRGIFFNLSFFFRRGIFFDLHKGIM